EDQQSLAADREAGHRIARAGLVQGKAAERGPTTGEEAFRERNEARQRFLGRCREGQRNGVAVRSQNADAEGTRKAEAALDGVIGGVLVEKTEKTGAGTDVGVGHAKVGAVEPALGGVGGIVASIAHPGGAELRNQGRLLEKGDLFGWDIQIRDQNFAETVAAENGGGVRDLI